MRWLGRIGETLWMIATALVLNASGYMLGKDVNLGTAGWMFIGGLASIMVYGFYSEWRGFRRVERGLFPDNNRTAGEEK